MNRRYREVNDKITLQMGEWDGNSNDENKRFLISKNKKLIITLFIILFLVMFFSLFLMVNLLSINLSIGGYFQIVKNNFQRFTNFIFHKGNPLGMNLVVYRLLIIGLVGAALSTSGSIYQAVFKNPMASPGILGVEAGGAFAGAVFIFFFGMESTTNTIRTTKQYLAYYDSLNFAQRYSQQLCIFISCLLSVFLIVSIAKMAGRGKLSIVSLLLVGTVFASLLNSMMAVIQYYLYLLDPSDVRISKMQMFQMGSFNGTYSVEHLIMMGIPILVCLILANIFRVRINVLVFGEDEAKSLGIKVGFFRNFLIVISTILSATTIAFCGQIGFMGLMVPHIARFIAGPDYKVFLPVSGILGAIMMIAIYNLSYMFNCTLYVNMFASFIGGPLFTVLMIRARRARNADWA